MATGLGALSLHRFVPSKVEHCQMLAFLKQLFSMADQLGFVEATHRCIATTSTYEYLS